MEGEHPAVADDEHEAQRLPEVPLQPHAAYGTSNAIRAPSCRVEVT